MTETCVSDELPGRLPGAGTGRAFFTFHSQQPKAAEGRGGGIPSRGATWRWWRVEEPGLPLPLVCARAPAPGWRFLQAKRSLRMISGELPRKKDVFQVGKV